MSSISRNMIMFLKFKKVALGLPLQIHKQGLAQLAGRAFLPGSEAEGFPQSLNEPRVNYPYVLHAKDRNIGNKTTGEECARAVRDDYRGLLTKHGVVLLRGFPLGDISPLNSFLINLGGNIKPLDYTSGVGIRKNLGGMLSSASDESKDFCIEGHNEMSYTTKWPTLLVFGCKVPSPERCGGETVLVDSRELYKNISRNIQDEFDKKGGVRYNFHLQENPDIGGFCWKNAFQTNDMDKVSLFLEERGIKYNFHPDRSLTYWLTRPLNIKHHLTGEMMFFNQVTAMHGSYLSTNFPDQWGKDKISFKKLPYHTLFGDGTEIPDDYIQHIRNVSWKLAIGIKLKKDDVLLIDNERMQHGRMSFTGDRQLMTALIDEL